MPHLPHRFRSIRDDAQPSQLAPSDQVPPDLIDVYDDLPVQADPPSAKSRVERNPVVRNTHKKVTGLDRISMKTFSPPAQDVSEALFGR